MSRSIYKLWIIRYKEAWYKLSKAKQDEHTAEVDEVLERVGGKRTTKVFSILSTEKWQLMGVEVFPNMDQFKIWTGIK